MYKYKKDYQKGKVYEWERLHVGGWEFHKDELTMHACRLMTQQASLDFKKVCPEVTNGRGSRLSYTKYDSWSMLDPARIVLCLGGMNHITMLHEIAHAFTNRHVRHGPEYVRMFIDLLVWHRYDRDYLVRTARESGIV